MNKIESKPKKIIWGFDPFETAGHIRENVVTFISEMRSRWKVIIEPVYILSPEHLDLSLEFSPPWLKRYKPAILQTIKDSLSQLNITHFMEPVILTQNRASVTNSVRTLAKYAQFSNATSILVGTHARKGISRLFLGSFAETLILNSKVPVIVTGPILPSRLSLNQILYPTDFSNQSALVFKKFLKLAKTLQTQLILLHAQPHPIEPVFQSGVYLLGGGWIPAELYLSQDETRIRNLGANWVQEAQNTGVTAKFHLDLSRQGAVHAILKTASQEKTGLIAMAAQSGALTSTLIGSITRQIVRSAPCPVWILRE